MAPQFPPMHHPFGAASVSHLVSFPVVRGPEDMMSSPQGPHLSYEGPRGFVMPPFSMYDGSTDPYDHMLRFNQTMILSARNDHLLCKVSLASLKGPTLAWFHKLPRGSINSFSELWAEFISQYLCSARQKGNIGSLQAILKREDESIRDFTRRFGQAVQQIDFTAWTRSCRNFEEASGQLPLYFSLYPWIRLQQ